MASHLRDRALPQQLAESHQVIDCKVEIEDLGRLAEIVRSDLAALPAGKRPANWRHESVGVRLEFNVSRFGDAIPILDGEASTTLDAVCKRCLEACRLPLTATIRYMLLPADAAAIDYEDYEVWELAEKLLRPLDIVEEVLIMAMPFPALHESADECGPLANEFSPAATDTAHPFEGLRAQLDESK